MGNSTSPRCHSCGKQTRKLTVAGALGRMALIERKNDAACCTGHCDRDDRVCRCVGANETCNAD
jgi:hypothetical protein